MKVVAKFGGSSLANANQFNKVRKIVDSNSSRNVIVVSAAGKSKDQPVKLTDQLIDIYERMQTKQDYTGQVQAVSQRLQLLSVQLGLKKPIQTLFSKIIQQLPQLSYAEFVSRGEFLTANLMSAYLDYPMIDAARFLVIENGQVDFKESKRRLAALMPAGGHCVIPGFYGVNQANKIQLLPRGGGDTTGAIIANLLDVDRYENWTDTSGILIADPRVVDAPSVINELSYNELQELSYLGMQVFQEEAIQPVRVKNIPIVIKNTNQPSESGTWVVDQKGEQRLVTGIAGRKHQTLITIHKYQLVQHIQDLFNLFNNFKAMDVKFSYVFNGNDQLNITLNHCNEFVENVLDDIEKVVEPDKIDVETDLALVGVVTDELQQNPLLVGQIVESLANDNVPVKTLFQGNGDSKVIFGVNDSNYHEAVQSIYSLSFLDQIHSNIKVSSI